MTTDISREELLAHLGYVRDDVRNLQTSVDTLGHDTHANTVAIAVLQEQLAAAATVRAQRRSKADAIVVALLGVGGAGLIEWIKTRFLAAAR
jgi:hypothetical protein